VNDRGWPDPRQWVGDAPYPWPAAAWLSPGDPHVACYTVVSVDQTRDADGQAVLEIRLADARSSLAGWAAADGAADWVRPGLYVGVRGTIVDAGGWTLLGITEISPIRVGLDDLALFLPHSNADPAVLEAELLRLIASVSDPGLRTLLERMLGADTEIGRGFRLAPAATRNHHACLGGLFEHTVSVARLCDFAADHYGGMIDRDLLITAALLHDVGKIREIGARAGFPYTDEGRLLGHILLGLQMTGDAARDIGLEPGTRLLLEHLIASHQGRYEWQSPREPRIIEAFVLHHIDDLDAKVDHARILLDTVDAGWTDYDRSLRRELLKHTAADSTPQSSPGGAGAPPAVQTPVGLEQKRDDGPAAHASGRTARRKSTRKKAVPGKAARKKRPSKKARKKSRTKKPATKKSPSPAPATPAEEPATEPPRRAAIIEPGVPGFIDTDTLDLFEDHG
jgi:3'-5' exoribonuclease